MQIDLFSKYVLWARWGLTHKYPWNSNLSQHYLFVYYIFIILHSYCKTVS